MNICKYLCDKHPQLVQVVDNNGDNVFHTAAYNNDRADVVPVLLACKPPAQFLKKKNYYGHTPLKCAKMKNNEDVLKLYKQYLKENK